MPDFLIAVFFGASVGGWVYSYLAKRNGNANPANNGVAALGAGIIAAVVLFSALKFILNI